MTDRPFRIAETAAWVVPPSVVLFLILRHGVNVPYWDQWELVGPLAALAEGGLAWSALFEQQNEHRMVFPKMVMLALAPLTRWNAVAEMLVGFGLQVASLALLIALLRPVVRDAAPSVRIWSAFTVSTMVFSLAQHENWLWGWQIQWFLSLFACVAAVALATWSLDSPKSILYVAGAMIAAAVCQFSIASGAALWPICAAILVFHPHRRFVLPAWIAAAAGSIIIYLAGYIPPAHHPSALAAVEHPLRFFLYLGGYLSGPLGRTAAIGHVAAAAFVVLAVLAIVRRRIEPALVVPWIAIACFGGANAVLTGIGRVGFGSSQALSSRYVTMALTLSVSLVPLGILALRTRTAEFTFDARRISGILGAAMLTVPVIVVDIRSLPEFGRYRAQMMAARECLLTYKEASDDCLKRLYPRPDAVRERAPRLERLGWSSFAR
jgi:hypothetical protein